MTANMAEMRVEGATVMGTEGKRDQGYKGGKGAYGAVAAALVIVALIAGLLVHTSVTKVTTITTAPAPAALAGQGMGQVEYDRILTAMEKVVGGTSPAIIPSEQQRFLEQNTILPRAWTSTYMEAVTPLPGQDR